jgi:hypothetical protein
MSRAVQRSWVPFAVLGVVVVAAIAVVRRPSAVSSPASASAASSSEAPVSSMAGSSRVEPPLTDREQRELHMHLAHELCEEGAKRINEIEGRAPTDPKGINAITACLGHGNVAWYKCILRASKQEDVALCNRRLLVGENGQ